MGLPAPQNISVSVPLPLFEAIRMKAGIEVGNGVPHPEECTLEQLRRRCGEAGPEVTAGSAGIKWNVCNYVHDSEATRLTIR